MLSKRLKQTQINPIGREIRMNENNYIIRAKDLHKTFGFSFDAEEREEGFFVSEAYQERFYRLWEEMARNNMRTVFRNMLGLSV